jgi:hypothetical protein
MGLLLIGGQFAAVFFFLRPDKTERVRLIDRPRGRDISHNFDVESRRYVVPVRGGILCSLCGSPVCAAIDRIVRGFVILRAVVASLPTANS